MVLEARYKAEKIWYPVVWEPQKESSDVIDYDIRWEITKDASAVFNANNNTTTGMATVIPWINAEKLIERTSIYKRPNPVWWVELSSSILLTRPDDDSKRIRSWTITKSYWNIAFKNVVWDRIQWSWFEIPESWWYQLYILYAHGWSTYQLKTSTYIARWWAWNDILIDTHTSSSSATTYGTVDYEFRAGDLIYVEYILTYSGSSSWVSYSENVTLSITKL